MSEFITVNLNEPGLVMSLRKSAIVAFRPRTQDEGKTVYGCIVFTLDHSFVIKESYEDLLKELDD